MQERPSTSPSAAFTLLEVLLSLAIAGVIVTLAFSLFHSTNKTLRGQQERSQVDRTLQEAFLQLERDLMNAVPPQGYPERDFIVTQNTDLYVELEFASMQRIPGERSARWADLMLLRYYVNEEGALIRESQSHLGAEDPQIDVLIKNCGIFQVTPSPYVPGLEAEKDLDDGLLPGGVECILAVAGSPERPLKARVLIPAGQKIMRSQDDSLNPGESLLRGLP